MLQTKSSPLKCVNSDKMRHSKRRVLIFHSDLLSIDDRKHETPDIVKLRHPRSGSGATFLFSRDSSVVQEVFLLSEKRSWFINDSVTEAGNIIFSTPIDPLFLILPYLKKSKEEGKVMPLQDLLIDDVFPETLRLLKSSVTRHIHLLADRKGSEDLNAWMYNEEKALNWLCKKTEKVYNILKSRKINVRGSATCRNLVKSVGENSEEKFYLKYAYELVTEYLTSDLSLKLSLGLNLEEMEGKKVANKRKQSSGDDQEEGKKGKWIEHQVQAQTTKTGKLRAMAAKEKPLKKTACGSRAITSFFKRI